MHSYFCTYMSACKYTYTYEHTYTNIRACIRAYMHTHIDIRIYVHAYIHAYILYIHTYTCMNRYTCIHAHAYKYAHAYIHTYIRAADTTCTEVARRDLIKQLEVKLASLFLTRMIVSNFIEIGVPFIKSWIFRYVAVSCSTTSVNAYV